MNLYQIGSKQIRVAEGKAYIDRELLKPNQKHNLPGVRWLSKKNLWYIYLSESTVKTINLYFGINIEWKPKSINKNSIVHKTKMYKHQAKAAFISINKKFFALLMEQGTGKSKVIIDTIMTLHRDKHLSHVMIICPKTVMGAWIKQLNEHAFLENFTVQRWGDKIIEQDRTKINVLIINIDAINTPRGYKYAFDWILNTGVNMLVVDESTDIKNHTAKRTERVTHLGNISDYRRVLTGTPISKNPLDIYSQFYFLEPQIFYGWSYFAFRSHFAYLEDYERDDGKIAKIVVGFRNQDELSTIIDPWSFRITKAECLDLPPKVYEIREITLSKKTISLYKKVYKSTVGIVKDEGVNINIPILLSKITKLQQICGGSVKNEDGTITHLDDNKIKECISIVEGSGSGVIIWCEYRHEVSRLQETFTDLKKVTNIIKGGISNDERDKAIDDFNELGGVIICQNAAGSSGITLNTASEVIFYSNSTKYMQRVQAEDRCHRIGQKKTVTYYDLICRGTVDDDFIESIAKKESLAKTVLNKLGVTHMGI